MQQDLRSRLLGLQERNVHRWGLCRRRLHVRPGRQLRLLREGYAVAGVQRCYADLERSLLGCAVYALRSQLHRLDEHHEGGRVRVREHEMVVRERHRLAAAVSR
jgi:hypothetical protein